MNYGRIAKSIEISAEMSAHKRPVVGMVGGPSGLWGERQSLPSAFDVEADGIDPAINTGESASDRFLFMEVSDQQFNIRVAKPITGSIRMTRCSRIRKPWRRRKALASKMRHDTTAEKSGSANTVTILLSGAVIRRLIGSLRNRTGGREDLAKCLAVVQALRLPADPP